MTLRRMAATGASRPILRLFEDALAPAPALRLTGMEAIPNVDEPNNLDIFGIFVQ